MKSKHDFNFLRFPRSMFHQVTSSTVVPSPSPHFAPAHCLVRFHPRRVETDIETAV